MGPRNKSTELVNEDIPSKKNVLLIDDEGQNLGEMPSKKALELAYDKDLDLVVVNVNSNPLVAKMMDYSKYKFDQNKKLKEMRKNQQRVQIKEIRLSHNIDVHDFDTKLKHAQRFIGEGNKVKITLRLYGRLFVHKDAAIEVVNKFIEKLEDSIIVDQKPKLEGRQLLAMVSPSNSNKK